MTDNKRKRTEGLFYNNKFLAVFSVVLALILWAAVKINYSADTVRVVNDVRVSLSSAISQESDYKFFVNEDELYVDVEISGKAYNINSNTINKDDIIVEATGVNADSTGYKVLSLNARFVNATAENGAQIISVSPSSLAVYCDREVTDTFNVEARLTNSSENIAEKGLTVGKPVPSMSTVSVTGPASVLSQLESVSFVASIDEKELPLSITTDIEAQVVYNFSGSVETEFVSCKALETNPPTVTVPVYGKKVIPTVVKFVNEPAVYDVTPPEVVIDPSEVEIVYNASGNASESFLVGTVNFRELSNQVNTISFDAADITSANDITSETDTFVVTIDLSALSSRTITAESGNFILLNRDDSYDYSVSLENGRTQITIIGPQESLDKLTADDIQLEINVSGVNLSRSTQQVIEISNISIQNEEIDDCWVYGEYTAVVSATPKNQE